MSSGSSSFGKTIITNTIYSLIDLVLLKLSGTVVFIILVRLLTESNIAAIGIGTGYLIFVSHLDVAPIRVLLRDYPQIAKDVAKRDHLLTALFLFWGVQTTAMLLVYLVLKFLVLEDLGIPGLSFLFFAMTMDFIGLSFQGWIKTLFYADFKQGVATTLALFLTIGRLLSYVILLFFPALATYSWILVITSVATCSAWWICFLRSFHFRFSYTSQVPRTLLNTLKDYGLWDHLNRTVINTLFVVDTVVLSSLGHMRDLANYTIALRFVSLLTLMPGQLARSLQLALANYKDKSKQQDAINSFFKLNVLLTVFQLVLFLSLGEWLLKLLFGQSISPDVVTYSLIIIIGVTIFNCSYPLISIINIFSRLKDAFLWVFLPSFIAGMAIYISSASTWGALGIAYANIVAYSVLALSLAVFTYRKHSFRIRLELMTSSEKRLLKEVLRRKQG